LPDFARLRNIPRQEGETANTTVVQPVIIRRAEPADGPALLEAAAAIDAETEFLGVPGQRHPWADRPEAELRSLEESGRGIVLLAVIANGTIVGYLSAFLGHFTRNRGNLFVAVVGLREAYRGQGIGTRLFEAIEAWARERHVWRLELRVSSLNDRGQALYRARDFAIEGTIRAGVFRRGAWTDDFWMGKLIEPLPGGSPTRVATDDARPVPATAEVTPQLRPMRSGDGAGFRAMDLRFAEILPFSLRLASEVAPAEAIERDIAAKPTDPRLWLVATVPAARGRDSIVGFATGNIEFGFRMQHDAFVNVAVLPEYQRQGLGRRLHDRIENWAIENGARRLSAAVQAPNQAGRAFAAAVGYETEVTMRGYALIRGRLIDRLRLGKLLAA
jgi:RimJ/RimL family protein N-acetyltransferase